MAGLAPFKHSAPGNEIRMVMIGKTGVGKSKTGNSIIGDTVQPFVFGCDTKAVTLNCSLKTADRCGRKLDVVDTPGVFDTQRANSEVQKEIIHCIRLSSPGPHALLFCVEMSRFTEEDLDTINHFLKYFGEDLLKYTIVVFTKVDQWEQDEKEKKSDTSTVEQYIIKLSQPLKKFVDRCDNRYMFVNNRLTGPQQEDMVSQLIQKIDALTLTNNNTFYTNKPYQIVEEALQNATRTSQKSRDEIKRSLLFDNIISPLIPLAIHAFKLLF